MKHFVTKLAVVVIVLSVNAVDAHADAKLRAHAECPDKFVGTVTNVSELEAPFASLNKLQVEFKVDHSSLGNFQPKRKLNVLKFGQHRFSKGSSYKLELENDLICNVKKINIRS